MTFIIIYYNSQLCLYHTILRKKSELQDVNSQLWESHNHLFNYFIQWRKHASIVKQYHTIEPLLSEKLHVIVAVPVLYMLTKTIKIVFGNWHKAEIKVNLKKLKLEMMPN